MCFFDQKVFQCGDWKWGSRREACSKAPAAGDSCRIKLIMNSQHTTEVCSICQYIETKRRRIHRLEANIKRWSENGKSWRASIEAAQQDIRIIDTQCRELDMKRASKQKCLAKASHTAADYRAVDAPFDQGWFEWPTSRGIEIRQIWLGRLRDEGAWRDASH
ncbi:hypothetical protein OIDMADRAFT_134003 [Oidiodendron maius Zn]|uniref:Uncharacterized protein n=1 Tax=Oidiodendron maius (strain Zn) TaxID=913774 RepID=A0A0C3GVS4_OIDMZ|nr:hypothetical protein OIDMADRAFT_134003 [Oidiodendron maius Zn]